MCAGNPKHKCTLDSWICQLCFTVTKVLISKDLEEGMFVLALAVIGLSL